MLRGLRGGAGAKEGESKSGAELSGDVRRVRSPEGEGSRHAFKKLAIGRDAVCGNDTGEAAHREDWGRNWFSAPA